jgi:hypothetical protein
MPASADVAASASNRPPGRHAASNTSDTAASAPVVLGFVAGWRDVTKRALRPRNGLSSSRHEIVASASATATFTGSSHRS